MCILNVWSNSWHCVVGLLQRPGVINISFHINILPIISKKCTNWRVFLSFHINPRKYSFNSFRVRIRGEVELSCWHTTGFNRSIIYTTYLSMNEYILILDKCDLDQVNHLGVDFRCNNYFSQYFLTPDQSLKPYASPTRSSQISKFWLIPSHTWK